MTLEIQCAGERLWLLSEKAVFWPRARSLIVSDLHFGKPAAFRKFGIAVPESTTASDLDRLDKVLQETKSKRLIILGDFFHALAGCQPEMMRTVESWCQKHSKLEIILIPGNHDRKSGAPPSDWNITNVDPGWSVPPFSFYHEPQQVAGSYVFCGHVHPAISLREKFGAGIRAPCFCFGSHRAIMPAFGSFTGMHNYKPADDERIFAIGYDEVMQVSSQ